MTKDLGERRVSTAVYLEEMLSELAIIGKNIDCDLLVFLLELAQQEAKNIRHQGPTPGRPRRGKRGREGERRGLTAEELAALFSRKPPGSH
ncbi:MAG: hypothetical protein ABJH63_11010 [Rhizobiaceae bacterium]